MSAVTVSKQLNVRLRPADFARCALVAAHYGLSIQSMLRMLVKREHDRLAAGGLREQETP